METPSDYSQQEFGSSCGSVVPVTEFSETYQPSRSRFSTKRPSKELLRDCLIPEEERGMITVEEWLTEQSMTHFNTLYLTFAHLVKGLGDWEVGVKFPQGCRFFFRENRFKKAEELSPSKYINRILLWSEDQFDNEDIFPQDKDVPFPEDLKLQLNVICRRLFRVYCILLYNEPTFEDRDFTGIRQGFKHFLFFCWFWQILEKKHTRGVLESEVSAVRAEYDFELGQMKLKEAEANDL